MTAITQQKADLAAIIARRLERSLESADVDRLRAIALGACRRLMARMTLNELQDWNASLTMIEEIREQEAER